MSEEDRALYIGMMVFLAANDPKAYVEFADWVDAKIETAKKRAIAESLIEAVLATEAASGLAQGSSMITINGLSSESDSDEIADALEVVGLRAVEVASTLPGDAGEAAVNAGVRAVHLSQEVRRDSSESKKNSSAAN